MEDLKIKSKVEEKISRRSFLRKAAYVAPVVVTLGALNAHAGTRPGSSVFTMYGGTGPLTTQIQSNTTLKYVVNGHQGVVDGGYKQGTISPSTTTTYSADAIIQNVSPDSDPTGQWNPFHQYFSQIITR